MIDSIKRKQVYEVLLMPINCEKHGGFKSNRKVNISKQRNCIISTETYWPQYTDKITGKQFRYPFKPDFDMLDFACGFYKIIYKGLLNGNEIVDEDGNFVDKEFAGDTMTSVSKLPGLRDKYHCPANFWILPMVIGRTSNNDWTTKSGYADELWHYFNKWGLCKWPN